MVDPVNALLNVRWISSDRQGGERRESIVIVTLRPAKANATLRHYLNISSPVTASSGWLRDRSPYHCSEEALAVL